MWFAPVTPILRFNPTRRPTLLGYWEIVSQHLCRNGGFGENKDTILHFSTEICVLIFDLNYRYAVTAYVQFSINSILQFFCRLRIHSKTIIWVSPTYISFFTTPLHYVEIFYTKGYWKINDRCLGGNGGFWAK